MHPLEKIFNPDSIAVIGASEVPGKASERRTRSLIEGGYQGKIYLINPKREQLFSRKAYPSILDADGPVDLVMIVVAPQFMVSAVSESIRIGAKGIIIITAGLGEATGEVGVEGRRIEQEILAEASKSGTYIIGPNCSGMFSAVASVNFLGVPPIKKGPLSILAQSGNVIVSLTHYARLRGIGFSKIISAGNAIGVKFHEYLEYLKDDPETEVIAMYLEGIKDGDKLIKVARETVKQKPIICMKVGQTAAGARAVTSHTGSLAGDSLIVDAGLRQAGVVRVWNVDELFDLAWVLSNCPLPQGNRVAIMSEGGGENAIAAENAEKYGMEVPILSSTTQEKLGQFLLRGMSAVNPIDYGGTAEENPINIAECTNVCMQDDQVDGVFVTGFFGGFKETVATHVGEIEEKTSQMLIESVKKYNKPLAVQSSFARRGMESLEMLKEAGVPVFESSERTAQVLGLLMQYVSNRKKMAKMQLAEVIVQERPTVKDIFQKVKADGRTNLLETESRQLLSEYTIALPETYLVSSAQEAAKIADKITHPVAMKVVSPDIIHKSDVGGVRLNLGNGREVQNAFSEILSNAEKVTTRERVLGILLSPMVPKGQECIIGMIRDQQFGPVIMFGLGGIFVEALKDVAFRVAPLAQEDIDEMVTEIKGYRILQGTRGESRKDIDAIKDILAKLSQIAIGNPEIQEIDLNPVIVHEKGASIVDSRVIIS